MSPHAQRELEHIILKMSRGERTTTAGLTTYLRHLYHCPTKGEIGVWCRSCPYLEYDAETREYIRVPRRQ